MSAPRERQRSNFGANDKANRWRTRLEPRTAWDWRAPPTLLRSFFHSPHSFWEIPLIRVGVVGFGYWGPNFVRVFQGLPGCELVGIVDKRGAALDGAKRMYPKTPIFESVGDL